MAMGVNHYFKDGRKHTGGMHKMPDGQLHSGKTHGKQASRFITIGELSKAD